MIWWFLLGLVTGMRALTAIAILSVCAAFGWFPALAHTWAFWLANPISAGIFSVLALGEYVGDLLPKTPSRRDWGPASARIVFGALVAAAASTAMVLPFWGGAIFGAIGAVCGTTGGWWLRRDLARRAGRDWPIGIGESLLAIAIAAWCCWKIHVDANYWNGIEHRITAALATVHALRF